MSGVYRTYNYEPLSEEYIQVAPWTVVKKSYVLRITTSGRVICKDGSEIQGDARTLGVGGYLDYRDPEVISLVVMAG